MWNYVQINPNCWMSDELITDPGLIHPLYPML